MKNLIIKDIPNVNVIFLKNLKIDSNKITIEYKSNDIKLILINIDAEIIMINKPDLIDCKSDKKPDKKTTESKHSKEIHSEEIHSEEELTEEKNTSEEELTEEKNTSEEELTEEKNTSEEEITEEKNTIEVSEELIEDKEKIKEDKEKIKEDKEKIKEYKEKIKEDKEKIKENKVKVIREYFGNKSGKCLKFEDMIIIGLIIYLAYKLMVPKRQIIKLNI